MTSASLQHLPELIRDAIRCADSGDVSDALDRLRESLEIEFLLDVASGVSALERALDGDEMPDLRFLLQETIARFSIEVSAESSEVLTLDDSLDAFFLDDDPSFRRLQDAPPSYAPADDDLFDFDLGPTATPRDLDAIPVEVHGPDGVFERIDNWQDPSDTDGSAVPDPTPSGEFARTTHSRVRYAAAAPPPPSHRRSTSPAPPEAAREAHPVSSTLHGSPASSFADDALGPRQSPSPDPPVEDPIEGISGIELSLDITPMQGEPASVGEKVVDPLSISQLFPWANDAARATEEAPKAGVQRRDFEVRGGAPSVVADRLDATVEVEPVFSPASRRPQPAPASETPVPQAEAPAPQAATAAPPEEPASRPTGRTLQTSRPQPHVGPADDVEPPRQEAETTDFQDESTAAPADSNPAGAMIRRQRGASDPSIKVGPTQLAARAMAEARQARDRGDLGRALDELQRVLELDPAHVEALSMTHNLRRQLARLRLAQLEPLDRVPLPNLAAASKMTSEFVFILQFADGVSTLQDVVDLTGWPQDKVVDNLLQMIEQQVLYFR